ncbi:hypothetical protein BpHYR1_021356 [Brachionus plicatilis]|uniref:Uncharacterized protein n=1 Tax=Brachionus plicatilis TaxID=10195 RepID=A0A3M7Q7C7_BRAPC|nr:hypothetical protein BpHYR1_021356 [Brachionus plicatilis]
MRSDDLVLFFAVFVAVVKLKTFKLYLKMKIKNGFLKLAPSDNHRKREIKPDSNRFLVNGNLLFLASYFRLMLKTKWSKKIKSAKGQIDYFWNFEKYESKIKSFQLEQTPIFKINPQFNQRKIS